MDLSKLEAVLSKDADKVPFIIITITNNTAGGQPVSMENLRGVRKIADKYGKRVVFDSARFAENAYFIKMREPEFKDATIKEICREMFSLADIMTMSSKKDGLVNMGGFIATRWEDMKAQISAGLNFAVSGIPYWTMDIGGFCVENRYVAGQMEFNKTGRENADYKEWRELNARRFLPVVPCTRPVSVP